MRMWKSHLTCCNLSILTVGKFSTVENMFSTPNEPYRVVENIFQTFHNSILQGLAELL